MKPTTPSALALAAALAACRGAQTPATAPRRDAPVAAAQEVRAAPAAVQPTAPGAPSQAPAAQAPAPTPALARTDGPWRPPSAEALAAMPLRQRAELSVVPFDDLTRLHVRALYAEGQRAGQRGDVFAKLGDSITESGSYLQDIGHGWYELGPWDRLEPVIRYFRRRSFGGDAENNSFSRASGAAEAGWTTGILLHGGDDSRLEGELAATRPAFAILMIGTNDAERSDVETFQRNLNEIARRVEARKVVLAVSTIPDQQSSAAAGAMGLRYNEVIRRVAWERHLPLVDYWASMQGLPNKGLDPDNVHPSCFRAPDGNAASAVFTDRALASGYNMRNLTTLLMLERLMQVLELRGEAAPAS